MKRKNGNGNAVAVCILSSLLVGTICSGVFTNCFRSFWWNMEEKPAIEAPVETPDNGDVEIGEGEEHGVRVTSYKIPTEEYGDYNVTGTPMGAYLLTAVITPEDATNQEIDWAITYADGTDCSDSGVTLTPSADGALTAVLEKRDWFNQQIQVKITSRANSEIYATKTVDCAKKINGGTASIGAEYIDFTTPGKEYTITVNPTFGEGTVAPNVVVDGGWLRSNIARDLIFHSYDGTTYYEVILDILNATYRFTGDKLIISTPWEMFGKNVVENGKYRGEAKENSIQVSTEARFPTAEEVAPYFNELFFDSITYTSSDSTMNVSVNGGYSWISYAYGLNLPFGHYIEVNQLKFDDSEGLII